MISRRRSVFAMLAASVIGLCDRNKGWLKFTASAYSAEGQTASGKQTREGRTVAADPTILPVGTRIQVADAGPYSGEYVVHDTGRTIKGREIDIFIDKRAEAKQFGRKPVRVRVLALPDESTAKR